MLPIQFSSLSVPLPALGSWRQAASVCGFPVETAFNDAGIGFHDKAHAPLRVAPDALLKAFSKCVGSAKGRHFPLVLGDCFVFEHFAEFDAFIAACSNVRDTLELTGWARELLAPWVELRLDEFNAEAHLRVEMMMVPEPINQKLAPVREVMLAVMHQLISRVVRGPQWLLSVRISGSRPEYHQELADHFGVPVFYNEGVDALVIDRRWLDAPLRAPVPQVLARARQMIERRLIQEGGERRMVDEVRWALERRPELLREGLDATAESLGLHPRTLQRRLQCEGVKYVDLQSEAKLHRARVMLRRRAISMESISDELGFSDRRAFTFAFKRWTGMSPSAYRNQLNSVAAAQKTMGPPIN